MKVKKINVQPIPAEVKEMKYNASTPRQEALRLQKQNTKEQVALMKAHHGGKGKLHTVPQFHTGAKRLAWNKFSLKLFLKVSINASELSMQSMEVVY